MKEKISVEIIYKKIAFALFESANVECLAEEIFIPVGNQITFSDFQLVLTKMMKRGWVRKSLFIDNEAIKDIHYLDHTDRNEYLYALTEAGIKKFDKIFKEEKEQLKHKYKFIYKQSEGAIFSTETGERIYEMRENTPMKRAFDYSVKNGDRIISLETIAKQHKAENYAENMYTLFDVKGLIKKSFENFRPEFFKKAIHFLNEEEKRCRKFSVTKKEIILPPYFSVEK